MTDTQSSVADEALGIQASLYEDERHRLIPGRCRLAAVLAMVIVPPYLPGAGSTFWFTLRDTFSPLENGGRL
jgi:hypothetical protein